MVLGLFQKKHTQALNQATDLQLIRLYQTGNDNAIATVFKKHYDELFHLCYSVLIDKVFADEIISKTLEGYLNTPRRKRKEKYNITSNVKGFLRRTVVRKCIDFNRKKSNQVRKVSVSPGEGQQKIENPDWNTKSLAMTGMAAFEVEHLLDNILANLVGKEKAVFDLHLKGYSHEEICTMLNLTTTRNVSSTLYNARKKAKEFYIR